jgi:galactokinase
VSGGVWRAPGRANLIGEHTDYNEGLVLPFALAQGVTATVSTRDDGLLSMASLQASAPVTVPLTSLAPDAVAGWAAYPAGVAWSLIAAGYQVPAATIEIDSDLPEGAGLSSSAALGCSVALALTALAGLDLPRPELAAIVRRSENEFVGVPSGLMDQSASLLCTEGHALLLDCRTLETSQVPFSPAAAGAVALLINTRAKHELTGGEFGIRQAECAEAARQLGVPALGYLTDASVAGQLADPVLRRRARHVITEDARVRTIVALLRDEAEDPVVVYQRIGAVMDEAHASLRDDFEVSWPEANVTVEVAVAGGALGARMIGGGFGGSVLALVPADRAAAVREAVSEAFAKQGWVAPEFLDATPSASATRLA